SGGIVRNMAITSKGMQIVLAGGAVSNCSTGTDGVQHVSGGTTYNTLVRPNGAQRVSTGKAIGTIVSNGGSQIISSGGIASSAKIYSGGSQYVRLGGSAVKTNALAGGKLFVSSGGKALTATVASGGIAYIFKGAVTSALTVQAAGTAYLYGGALSGTNTFSGATVNVMGTGVKINKINANSATTLNYAISNMQAGAGVMLAESVQQNLSCSFSITAGKAQQIGTYKLSSKLNVADNTVFSIKLGSTSLGTAKLNGAALTKNGVTYKLTDDAAGTVSLTLSMKAGNMLKGSTGADTLTGTASSDIFYGGKGNDTITGTNGRDVAVYAKAAWGQDTIQATNGTMTLLFGGLSASDITQAKNGTNLVLTRKSDTSQKITVQGWNDSTHKIVYVDTLTEFNKYLNAASPTTAQTTAARNEVWQKAGLAAKA
ncbi:MAG: AIDA repeat-containing protein, partial [Deltaproteobacteria bacterium]|nr:AIDA repeat-containing protein [Deltaproteobacteria bacterium]